jgi:hypothetical protein
MCLRISKATLMAILTPRLFFNQVTSLGIDANRLIVAINCEELAQLLVFISFFQLKVSSLIESLVFCCYIPAG